MTQSTPDLSSSDTIIMVAIAAGFTTGVFGVFLGLSSLFGARWWVNLVIVLVAAGATLAMFESEPDSGLVVVGLIVLFSLYGFVSTFGWLVTVAVVAIVVVSSAVVLLLAAVGPAPEPPAPGPSPRRAAAPPRQSPPSPPGTASDEALERYAREFLAEGGPRDTRAVMVALRSRVRAEGLKFGQSQDLSWIASRALASTRSPVPPTRSRSTPAPRQQAVQATEKPRRNVRENLHEFGSFEIEQAISKILDGSPRLTDEQLVDRVLEEFGIFDRSPFAMERLSDAIGRVRGIAPPSAEDRQVERRKRRIASVPKRDPGGRTNLYEYGSHEIERVVEQLITADRQWGAKDLHEAVLEVLGIEDRSGLGRERVADAAKKVLESPVRSSGAVGRQRRPTPKKPEKKTLAPKKATKKKPKPAAKKTTKKATEARKTKATEDATRQKPASTPERTRETGRTTPPPAPVKKPSKPESDEGTPDVKDIAKLLGF